MFESIITNVIKYIEQHPWQLWILSGFLLGIAFWHPFLWWTALVGVGLFWQALQMSQSWRQALGGGLLAGWIQFALVLWWGWSLYPLTFFEVPALPSVALIMVTVALGWLPLGLARLFTVLVLYRIRRHWYAPWLLIPAWLGSDMLATVIAALVNYGPGTAEIAPAFTFGWLGYLLAEHPFLLPLAAVGGVYLLSLAYVAIVVLCIVLWQRGVAKVWIMLGLGIIILSSAVSDRPRQHRDEVQVVALETAYVRTNDVGGEERAQQIQNLMQTVTAAIDSGAEYVIVPEGVNISRAFASSSEALAYFASRSSRPVVVIDTLRITNEDGNGYLRARYYDTSTMQVYELDKQYLVPSGEYVPYLLSGLLHALGYDELAMMYTDAVDYRPGPKNDRSVIPAHLPGVLFCFESIQPNGVRQAAADTEVDFIVHPVSYGWFNEPMILWHQLDQMLKVNARYGGVTVYRAANLHTSERY